MFSRIKESFKNVYYFYIYFFIKYFSLKKFFNLLVVGVEFFLKREKMIGKPFIASIDPANICILHCPLCPTGRGDKGVKKGILSFDDFKKYFDQIKDYLFVVRLYNWGEPFLAKDIFKMIEYAHKNKVGVMVNSNLNVISAGLAEKIVKSELDFLLVSIDGICQETYGKYRKGGELKKVFKIINQIVRLKEKFKSKTPILHWSYLVNKYNYQDIPRATIMAKRIGFNLITFPMLSMVTKVGEKFNKKDKYYWMGEKLTSQRCETPPPTTCYFLWSSINIYPNGDVFPCCGIYENKYAFGNLNKNSLKEIWNNQKFISGRRLFKKKSLKKSDSTICYRCDWFKKSEQEKAVS